MSSPNRASERAAIGVWGGVVGISIGLGPVVGGVLIETVGWRGIFWINIPIGVAAIVLTALFVPESRAPRARRPDVGGQVLVVVTLATLTYAIIEAPHHGWTSASTVTLLAVAAVAAVAALALLSYERRRRDPLLELRFFRSVPFSGATLTAVCAFAAYAGFLLLNTLYLQDVRGYSPLQAGVCTVPLALGSLIMAPLSGRIVGTRGPRIPTVGAGLAILVAGAMLAGLRADTSLIWVLASYVVFSIGFGLVNAPITNSAVAGMPRSQAGVAAAIASTSRQIGATLGVAVAGSLLNSGLAGASISAGFVDASTVGWWIVAGCGAAVLVLGLVTSSPWARRTADETARRFAADEHEILAAAA